MSLILFTYRGKDVKGFIEASTQGYPHYYWRFLEDAELMEEADICLSFTLPDDGVLQPNDYYSQEHLE